MNKSGLKKVKRSTKTGTRSYWVRAQAIGRKESLRQGKLESNGNRNPSMGQRILHKITGLLPGKKQGQVLNSMHPWEPHHTEHVRTTFGVHGEPSAIGGKSALYGSSGPGSDHSFRAILTGAARGMGGSPGHNERFVPAGRLTGRDLINTVSGSRYTSEGSFFTGSDYRGRRGEIDLRRTELAKAFGVEPDHVRYTPQRSQVGR